MPITNECWQKRIGMLERGESPNGLPINPPRKDPLNLEPGNYSYIERGMDSLTGKTFAIRRWFTIWNLEDFGEGVSGG